MNSKTNDFHVADIRQADFGRAPQRATYQWVEGNGETRKHRSETYTAFTWEQTDKADELREAAGIR